MERAILKSRAQPLLYVQALPTAPVMSHRAFIAARTKSWFVPLLCRTLAVSPVGNYQWRQRPPHPLRGKWRRKRHLRAAPGTTAPGGCEPSYMRKATPWGATRCARRCTSTTKRLWIRGGASSSPLKPLPWPRTACWGSRFPLPRIRSDLVGDVTYLPLVGGRRCYEPSPNCEGSAK